MIAAIVLAAGKSERMGRPKALVRYQGASFLERILDSIAATSIPMTRVVVGGHRDEILSGVRIEKPVYNPDFAEGMTTSFQAGIRALPADVDGAMVFLVDHPLVLPSTIEALLERFEDGSVVLPVFEGLRGHPVLFSKVVLKEILALPPTRGVDSIVRAHPERIRELPVSDRGVVIDIDTPEDLERWKARAPEQPE